MTISNELSAILRCPSSGESLYLNHENLSTVNQNQAYPIYNGVPWVLPNPKHSLLDWQIKISSLYDHLLKDADRLTQNAQNVVGKTQSRLVSLAEGKAHFAHSLLELTAPIMQCPPDQHLLNAVLPDQAPRLQTVLSYEANVYRDWVWGDVENQQCCELVMTYLSKVSSSCMPNRLFVPGVGAGRMAYDLKRALPETAVIASDINPFLLFIAQRMAAGAELALYEFPSEPVKLNDVAVLQHLSGKGAQDVQWIFSNVLQNPFVPSVFDVIVTPWLIDILPYPLSDILKAINGYLPEGGCWINYGSLVFHHQNVESRYTFEELSDLAKTYGFEIEAFSVQEMPYLRSPHNVGYRVEKVWSWRAVKTKTVDCPNRVQILPPWLLDETIPVPDMMAFSKSSKHQLITGEILGWANGQLSLKKMAARLSKKQKIDKTAALQIVCHVFRSAHERHSLVRY